MHGASGMWLVPILWIAFAVFTLALFRREIAGGCMSVLRLPLPILAFALVLALVGNDSAKPDQPPSVVVTDGIEMDKCTSDENGLDMSWHCSTNIAVGTDEFRIMCRERQIPSRTGYSAWRELARTKGTNYTSSAFFRNRDVQFKIQVVKEME